MTTCTYEDLAQEIQSVILESLSIQVETPETDLLAAGLLDSLRLIGLLVELEQRFNVRFDYEALEVGDLRSPATLAALVAKRRRGENVSLTRRELAA